MASPDPAQSRREIEALEASKRYFTLRLVLLLGVLGGAAMFSLAGWWLPVAFAMVGFLIAVFAALWEIHRAVTTGTDDA